MLQDLFNKVSQTVRIRGVRSEHDQRVLFYSFHLVNAKTESRVMKSLAQSHTVITVFLTKLLRIHSSITWTMWWRINTLHVSRSQSSWPSQPSRCAVQVAATLSCCTLYASLWLSNPTNWFLVDQEDAGGEDGPRGCGARAWGGQHHRGGREHLDCQPLWPPGKDLESWATSKTGKECPASLLS